MGAAYPGGQAGLRLTDPGLGLVLLGATVGSVAGMIGTGLLLGRLASRRMIGVALAGNCVVGVAVGLAATPEALFGALAVWGVFQGSLDVAMNTQAVGVERAAGRPLMSGFHGMWSLGGLVGAGMGAAGVAVGAAASTQLVVSGVVIGALGGWACARLVADTVRKPARSVARRAGNARAVLVLGAVAMASLLCEGAAAD